ncbi:Gfo/Idh/MocA family protein [Haloarchaeobius baliensis]|uniref:Gfo/Idh/MocA family protein n=1 Tax=Haloarchaeobius baliensis TaxID=1670458 RepID=UPI003F88321F
MLTVGIVGCGKASKQYHFPVVEALDRVELAWVCDLDTETARAAGVEHDVPWYDDVDEAYESLPDIVHVNTPVFTHAELTKRALHGGSHVLVEKPMAMTVAECEQMQAAAEETGRKLCVVHNNLFFDPMRAVMERVADGKYGDLVTVRSFLGGQPNPDAPHRGWTDDSHGGPIGDRLPHPIYLVTHFMDDVSDADVTITSTTDDGDVLGVTVALSQDDRVGLSGTITASEHAIPSKRATVIGEDRLAVVDLFNYAAVEYSTVDRSAVSIVADNARAAGQLVTSTVGNVLGYALDQRGPGSKYAAPGHYALVEQFVDAIVHDREPPVTAADGIRCVTLLERIEAAREEQAVGAMRADGEGADEPSDGADG